MASKIAPVMIVVPNPDTVGLGLQEVSPTENLEFKLIRDQKQDGSHSERKTGPKIDPESTRHMTMYKKLMKVKTLLGDLFGIVLSYDWKPHHHFMFWNTSIWLSVGIFSIVYTIAIHYIHGDYIRIIEPLAIVGITFSCVIKWVAFLSNWRNMWSILFFLRKLCRENVTGRQADILWNGLCKIWLIFKVFFSGMCISTAFYVGVPLYFFFMENRLIPLVPKEVPFCDQSTLSGYLSATVVMLVLGLYAVAAIAVFGLGFLINMNSYLMYVDLLAPDFADLDEMWDGSSVTSIIYRHVFLYNICKKVQDIDRFLIVLKKVYELKFFVYFLLNYFAQNNWIPGYMVASVLFLEMTFYCFMGTQISIGNDNLCDMICATNWYNYDLISQQIIRSLLHTCQQPKQIMLGTLGPLDVVTCTQIMKSIYTFYTVMMELL